MVSHIPVKQNRDVSHFVTLLETYGVAQSEFHWPGRSLSFIDLELAKLKETIHRIVRGGITNYNKYWANVTVRYDTALA